MKSNAFITRLKSSLALPLAFGASFALIACQNTAPTSLSQSKIVLMSRAASVDGIALSAPEYAMISVAANFALNASGTASVTSAVWDFGDGSPTQASVTPVSYIYYQAGSFTVSVTVTDSAGVQAVFSQPINVIAYNELNICISDLSLSVPNTGTSGQMVTGTVSVPSCMTAAVSNVTWNFGDGSTSSATGNSAQYTYSNAGTYTVTASIYLNSSATPSYFLTQTIVVSSPAPVPTPVPSVTPSPTPSPTPTPTPTTTPTPMPSVVPSPTPSVAPSPTPTPTPTLTPDPTPTPSPTPSPTPTTNPHGNYCDCRHHYHWDLDALIGTHGEVQSDAHAKADGDDKRDWGRDCNDWFKDHRDWYGQSKSWFKDTKDGQNRSDSDDDKHRCEDHGHHDWDKDCDDWRKDADHKNDKH